jgi:glutamate carboxypeptidase
MRTLVLRIAVACTVIALATTSRAAGPDERLLTAARAAQSSVIDSLREMVLIESGTKYPPGLARMADYTERRLQAIGARTERIKVSKGTGEMIKGTFVGTGSRRIMLIAHMDTVYPENTLAKEPYRVDGNRLYGPGIADDKSGIAIILHSMDILQQAGWRDYAHITVLFNPDEESQSIGSGETIAAMADEHEVVLSYEPTAAKAVAKDEGILLSAAGNATVRIDVKGKASHAGAAPEEGRNALIELSHQLLQTQDVAKSVPGTQLNWTLAQAGQARNQIPDHAYAIGDMRLTVAEGVDRLLGALRSKVAESQRVPDTEVSIKIDMGRPPYVASERSRTLARKAQAIYAELDGRKLIFHPDSGAGTDAGYAARSGKAVVLESLALAGWGYHASNEYIEVDSIVPRLYLTTRLLMEIARE